MAIPSTIGRFVTACRQSKYATFYLFCLFAFSLFVQCLIFNWVAFRQIAFSSLWREPRSFWVFYLPKMSVSLLIATFVFLTRKKWWTIVVSLLVDIWIIANLIYYRTTRIFISAHSFQLLGNMDGFWDCIPMYMDAQMLELLFPTLLVIFAVYLFGNKQRSLLWFATSLALSILFDITTCNVLKKDSYSFANRFYFSSLHTSFIEDVCRSNISGLPKSLSVLHALVYDTECLVRMPFNIGPKPQLTDEEKGEIANFTHPKGSAIQPQTPLVLILVESMETWAIHPDITPNLCRFVAEHESVLCATFVESQTKGGQSGDGQMIFNTGLLPIAEGAVCNRFANNVYPSLSDLYDHTAMIQAGSMTLWNQDEMNHAYHIDTAYLNMEGLDERTFFLLDSIATRYDYILAMTMATHTPFSSCAKLSPVRNLPADMPTPMANYLHSMHYTDSCWGAFLQRIDTDSVLRNSTIAIMGDHIIFHADQRQEFQSYCDAAGQDFTPRESYTALVVYSPAIQEKTVIDTPTYQMDAYPTLLHLIGGEAYYWQGFGVNLLDTAARTHRPIEVNRAYQLSDQMIQADYFR